MLLTYIPLEKGKWARRGQPHPHFLLRMEVARTVVPRYPEGIHSKTPSGCLKLWIVPNPKYTMLVPIHTYIPMINLIHKLGIVRD